MKKLITICVGLIVAGYATAAQPDEANAKIQELEKKVEAADAKIQDLEKRLSAIENAEIRVPPSTCRRRLGEIAAENQKRGNDLAIQKRDVDISVPNVKTGLVVIYKKAGGFTGPEQLKGKKIGVQGGTMSETYVLNELKQEPERSDSLAESVAAFKSGRVEFIIADIEPAKNCVKGEPDLAISDIITSEVCMTAIKKERELKEEKWRERMSKAAEEAKAEKEAKKLVADTLIDQFLKEYLGVQFGDSIDKFPGEKQDANPNTRRGALLRSRGLAGEPTNSADTRNIPVLKKFKYFDKAYGKFFEGKLYRVEFRANIDKKYSFDSTREKINQAVADLAATLGLESSAFKDEPWHGVDSAPSHAYFRSMTSAPRTSYTLDKIFQSYLEDVWVYTVSFEDAGLRNRLREEKRKAEAEERRKKNAEGETLPDPE